MLRHKDLKRHLTHYCYLRPYTSVNSVVIKTHKVITGHGLVMNVGLGYFGHQANCPEVPLVCPNRCGSKDIKRKGMDSHHN